MVFLGLVLVFISVLLFVFMVVLRWNEVRYRREGLPPGTMGLPLIGETSKFFREGPSFIKNQSARYGTLFKSHILGCPTVVCIDPEFNRSILMSEEKGLVPGYPKSMVDVLGKNNIGAVYGSFHKTLRSVLFGLIGPSVIRDQLLPKIDESIGAHLANWHGKIIDIQEKTEEMWVLLMLKLIAGAETEAVLQMLTSETHYLLQGTFSFPINFPGTKYRRGLQARKKILSILQEVVDKKRASSSSKNEMLDFLLTNDNDTKANLTDEQIFDLLLTLVHSGFETVSTTSMMAVKFLSDHPQALVEIRNEHSEIRKKKSPGDAINWNDYKSMKFTRAVILETSRVAAVVNGVLRKTINDIEMKGFVIPKGWRIYVCSREMNYDPFVYPEPLSFNPWRWLDGNLESHQNFLGFGAGSRRCPGKEMGTAVITIFLHYLVTRYSWEEVGRNEILKFPRVEAPNGLHFRVWNS